MGQDQISLVSGKPKLILLPLTVILKATINYVITDLSNENVIQIIWLPHSVSPNVLLFSLFYIWRDSRKYLRDTAVVLLAAKLCRTLCKPMNCSPPGSSVHGTSQARILDWIAISFSKGSSRSRSQTHVSWINRWTLYGGSQQESPIWKTEEPYSQPGAQGR